MLTEAPSDHPIDRMLEHAVAAYRTGQFADAESQCRNILKRQPDHIASLQVLAAVAGRSGSPRRGIELLQKVIALKPKHGDGHVQLAKMLRQEGRIDEAVASLEKAIELEPESAAAYNDLGLLQLGDGKFSEAVASFDRAIAIDPSLTIAHFNKGLALERQGRFTNAIAVFRHATVLAPDFAEAYAKLGNLLLSYGEDAEAFDCLKRAFAAKPESGVGLMCRARVLVEERKPAEAEETLRRAIGRDPQSSDAHSLLATVLMELGKFEDAAASADLALALNRQQIAPYHVMAHAKTLSDADRPLAGQMEWMLKSLALAGEAQSHLHFALGKAYDDLGEYERAMRHFDDANRLKHRKDGPYRPLEHTTNVGRIIDTFTADFFARNAGLGSDWDAPVFILGMPRSGTTLVEQILSCHPEIVAGDELGFWGERAHSFAMDSSGRINPAWAADAARDYRTLLTGISATAKYVTDKRPQNFNVIALIHAVFPRARIIHCRRHPVDTCLSIYFQNFARKMDFAYDRADLTAYYRQYLRLMDHWRKVLPGDRFIEIQYEDLVADPEPLTRQLIAFCGLDWNDACLHSERNRRPVRTASVWQARQPIYRTSTARWRKYAPWLGPLQELLATSDRV